MASIYWDLLLGDKSPAERYEIYASKNNVIAQLHMVDYESVGLSDYGKPGNYIARQVSRWTKQYIASETQDIPAMNNLIDWLPSNIPDEDETTIVHGDYRLDNMVFNANNNVMGVLDWELSTLGHPIADFNYHCISWRNIPDLADEKFCKKMAFQLKKNTGICILKLLAKTLMTIGSFILFLISLNWLEFSKELWAELEMELQQVSMLRIEEIKWLP